VKVDINRVGAEIWMGWASMEIYIRVIPHESIGVLIRGMHDGWWAVWTGKE
jgi:hypothetical protein